MTIAYIWILGFVLSMLAAYFKDMRGKYVSGGQLIGILFISVIPFFNFVFGISYFIAEFLVWCTNSFTNKYGSLEWENTKFKWVKGKK